MGVSVECMKQEKRQEGGGVCENGFGCLHRRPELDAPK